MASVKLGFQWGKWVMSGLLSVCVWEEPTHSNTLNRTFSKLSPILMGIYSFSGSFPVGQKVSCGQNAIDSLFSLDTYICFVSVLKKNNRGIKT